MPTLTISACVVIAKLVRADKIDRALKFVLTDMNIAITLSCIKKSPGRVGPGGVNHQGASTNSVLQASRRQSGKMGMN